MSYDADDEPGFDDYTRLLGQCGTQEDRMQPMRVAVDIDGTITRWPGQCKAILNAFSDAVILTGNIHNGMTQAQLVAGRIEQLRPYIGDVTNKIIVCVGSSVQEVGRFKGEYCRDNLVDILIDDSDVYLDAVRRISPGTARWKSMQ